MVGQTTVVSQGPAPLSPTSFTPSHTLPDESPESPLASVPPAPPVPSEAPRTTPQVPENAGKRRAGMYIMPDGRPLAAYLSNSNPGEANEPRRMAPKGKKNQRKKKGSTTFGSRRSAPAPSLFASQLDEQELSSLNKLGQRKQRRWTNDLLLRAMAPEMSPSDIDGLFKPVPFGDMHPPSAFSMVQEDAGMQELWTRCLLSVGMDKQERILEKWRDYVNDLNKATGEGCSRGGRDDDVNDVDDDRDAGDDGDGNGMRDGDDRERRARDARRATISAYRKRWQGSVSSSGRSAVKSVSEEVVREIEAQMLPCLLGAVDKVELFPEDGYGRLLGHSLAKFHGLASDTKRDDNGGKYIVVRRCGGMEGQMYIALSDWLLGCCQ